MNDAVMFAQEMSSMWVSKVYVLGMQAVGLLLPWWVEHAVPAMLTFMAADREAKRSEHAN